MTVWMPNDDGYADLTSHDTFVNGLPLNTFQRLRLEDPVHWTEWSESKGFWSITRHADIMAMTRDVDTFSSAQGIRMEDQSHEEYMARRTFQEMDPPEHTTTRMRMMKPFSRSNIATFEDTIRQLCTDILDEVLAKSEFDATYDIARELPMKMLGRIMGLPEEDLPWLVEKGDALMANSDADFTSHVVDQLTTDEFRMMPFNSPAGAELYTYARQLVKDQRTRVDDTGIINTILAPDKNGEMMNELEFLNFFCLLVAAGNDTTRYSIATGLHALCQQPELLGQMKEGGDIWKTAPDEIIRWASPTSYFRRTATRDVEMHGKTIKKGDKVLYWYPSGSRDETVFENPLVVNLFRNPNPHLAFGQGGPHLCLGRWLAKLEVKVLFQEFSKRVNSIEAAGEHQFLRSNFVNGIKKLPVKVTL